MTLSVAEERRTLDHIFFWVWLQGIAYFISVSLYNLAYWIFAFEYFSIARNIPCALQKEAVPESTVKCDKTVNVVFLSLSIAFPLGYTIFEIILNTYYFSNPDGPNRDYLATGMEVMNLGIGISELVSGSYLLVAIMIIRKFIKKGIRSEHLNNKLFVLHALAFVLYIMSIMVHVFFQSLYMFKPDLNNSYKRD